MLVQDTERSTLALTRGQGMETQDQRAKTFTWLVLQDKQH
jgi:hypothetical protein